MVDREKLKQRAIEEIEKADEEELKRAEEDRRHLREWLSSVLNTAWDILKSAIGGFIASVFGL
jgi:hypothetical protein